MTDVSSRRNQKLAGTHAVPISDGRPNVGPHISRSDLDCGTIAGIWRVGKTIHQGRYSTVALAQPADASGSPRWDYVIKFAADQASDVEARRQIAQSMMAAAQATHPNLIAVLDASATASRPYLVMPFLEGATMQWHLDHGDDKPLPVALWLVRQIAQALDALHTAGWIHGDVKPENAIVGSRGHVTLLDLGFAARMHTVSTHTYRGTPEYSAPEAMSGDMAALPAMDVFSLGRVLWQWMMRTGEFNQTLLEPVAELVESMISPDPNQRPSAANIVKQLLRLEIETLGQHIGPGRRAA